MDRPHAHTSKSAINLHIRRSILLVLWALIAITTLVSKALEKKEIMIISMPDTIWLKHISMPHDNVKIKLSGPIDNHLTKRKRIFNSSAVEVRVEWRDLQLNNIFVHSSSWHVYLLKNESKYRTASRKFLISLAVLQKERGVSSTITATEWALAVPVVSVKSKCDHPVGLKMIFDPSPVSRTKYVLYALCLVIILYAMIITEYINRDLALILLCISGVTLMAIIKHKPTHKELVEYIPFGSLVILLGSMIILTLMSETGFVDYVALVAYRISKGNSWVLIFLMCMFTATISAVLDSVHVILLLAPAAIRLCEAAFINTKYFLIIMAMYSNMGGSITPVGSPPNIIVASDPVVQSIGIDFSILFIHMLPICVISMLTVFGLLFCCVGGRIYKVDNHQLARRRALKKPTPEIKDRIKKLKKNMQAGWWLKPDRNYFEALAILEANQPILNMKLLAEIGIAVFFAICGFCTISVPKLVPIDSIFWITLLSAFLMLILANMKSISTLLGSIEWGMVLYLISLFIITEVIVELGFISWLGNLATEKMLDTNINEQTITGMMVILWASTLASALIDHSAVATIMLKLCIQVGLDEDTAAPLGALVWALLLGTNSGGTGTLLSSVSNEFLVLSALQRGYKISFLEFSSLGFPVMIVSVIICTVCLLAATAIIHSDPLINF